MAAGIITRINGEPLARLGTPVERVTGEDVPFPLYARKEEYMSDPEQIRSGIERG